MATSLGTVHTTEAWHGLSLSQFAAMASQFPLQFDAAPIICRTNHSVQHFVSATILVGDRRVISLYSESCDLPDAESVRQDVIDAHAGTVVE